MAGAPQGASDPERQLWFSPPGGNESRRRALTRERVVAEALAVIGQDGASALSMRNLAARLGVVPAALYRYVRSKEQLCDLAVDGAARPPSTAGGHRAARWRSTRSSVNSKASRCCRTPAASPGTCGRRSEPG